jgi:uncharacterized protein (DUF2249 family)
MSAYEDALAETDAPLSGPRETLDVSELPPPEPLTETIARLEALAADGVLVQVNDREPQHLYPKLADLGYAYDTVTVGEDVVTAIWEAQSP